MKTFLLIGLLGLFATACDHHEGDGNNHHSKNAPVEFITTQS